MNPQNILHIHLPDNEFGRNTQIRVHFDETGRASSNIIPFPNRQNYQVVRRYFTGDEDDDWFGTTD